MEVPDEQLARGRNRGRWSYRGVLLNRVTNLLILNDNSTIIEEQQQQQTDLVYKGEGWRIQRGGDLLGLDSSEGAEFVCLHHLDRSDPTVRVASTKLVGDLSWMTLTDAQSLCKQHPTKVNPNDFLIFGGHCKWRPGQLEVEMGDDRNEWLALSVDGTSIWEELQQHQQSCQSKINDKGKDVGHGLLQAGTDMWRHYLDLIDMSESRATERLPAGQLDFYDRMLEVWAEDNLNVKKDDADSSNNSCLTLNDSSDQIGPGTLVRAKSPASNDMLLFDAEFIRSIVLVLEETSEATVGILLNHPTAAAIECKEGEDPLPLRYGGPIDVPSWKDGTYRQDFGEDGKEDDEQMYEGFADYQNDGGASAEFNFDDSSGGDFESMDEDDSQFIWIHRDAALGSQGTNGGGGSQLGTSDTWLIKEDDALEALQSGFLCLEDLMVFSGVCIWEKGDLGMCGGGLREQIDVLNSLEVVTTAWNDHSDDDVIESVWNILSKHQNVLVKESLEGNINAAIDAWKTCSNKINSPLSDQNASRERLADAAMKAWLGVNLLEEPYSTLVELRDDQRRELYGQ
mmetsp:Transcript_34194/g.61403  ORF Transcript_34194/g.61403 Transcript_34194/m.61403 type:complete len:568 (-) Transcript_34194:437-2140(-)